jgi:hypothetical protein
MLSLTLDELSAQKTFVHDDNKQFIPIGGNAWVFGGKDSLTNEGLQHWTDPATVCKMFVRLSQPGTMKLSLMLTAAAQSRFKVTIMSSATIIVAEKDRSDYPLGAYDIMQPGYVSIEIQGIDKTGENFGSVSGIVISGTAVTQDASYVKDNEGNYFYWGRRGPSVHLRFDTRNKTDIEWFYSEITVPAGNDVMGSYFMANGFGEGYFGMQVNSKDERRILFSVWSPFKTDDPKAIPESDRIVLLKKGEGVRTGEFGNEGSGGQSFYRYMWKADQTYSFLLHGVPDGSDATVYTAWFFAPETYRWQLIASFRRPKKATYLTNLYSFLENFIPETGNIERMARYGNQWVRDAKGEWMELTSIKFTGDNTARKNYRKDYSGGSTNGTFFLRNCGFFSDFTELDQTFSRLPSGKPPKIDFSKLP